MIAKFRILFLFAALMLPLAFPRLPLRRRRRTERPPRPRPRPTTAVKRISSSPI